MKKIILLFLVLAIMLTMVGCGEVQPVPLRGHVETSILRKALYGHIFRFTDVKVLEEGDRLPNIFIRYKFFRDDPNVDSFTDVVFVMSPVEAVGFDDAILVAWPSHETWSMLEALNAFVRDIFIEPREDLAWMIETFPNMHFPETLSYPLTVEDLVERWQDVWQLYDSLPSAATEVIEYQALVLLRERETLDE